MIQTATTDSRTNPTMPGSPTWSESMAIGHPHIDEEHQRLLVLIVQLQEAPDDDLHLALKAVLNDATAHFSAENDLMTATGFPPRACHIKEHEAVLATLHGVAGRLAQGDREVVRRLSAELAAWFPRHVQHLDSALSHWLCKLQHDAKPVVLHIGGGEYRAIPDLRDVVPASA